MTRTLIRVVANGHVGHLYPEPEGEAIDDLGEGVDTKIRDT